MNGLWASVLMLYLTDYANLFPGQPGAAAAVVTTLLVVGRVWDAVNDPLLGFLIDKGKRTRFGRYKPFALFGLPTSAILLVLLFNLPADWPDTNKIVLLYVLAIAFDSIYTLVPFYPIVQTLTPEARVRSKLLAVMRVPSLLMGIAVSFFMAIATALGTADDPNIGLTAVVFIVPVAIISFIGFVLIKEGTAAVDDETPKLRDVWTLLRRNPPLWISQIAVFLSFFVLGTLAAGGTYYVKYAFGVENFGLNTALLGMSTLVGSILGVIVVQPFMKRFTPGNVILWLTALNTIPVGALFLLNLNGPIASMPLFAVLYFVANGLAGAAYIPGNVILMECMDYNKVRNGRAMQGTISSVNNFFYKLQRTVGTALIGGLLVVIGYDVVAYEDAEVVPRELFDGLGLISFLIPAIMGLLAVALFWLYPLRRKATRDALYEELEAADVAPDEADSVEVVDAEHNVMTSASATVAPAVVPKIRRRDLKKTHDD